MIWRFRRQYTLINRDDGQPRSKTDQNDQDSPESDLVPTANYLILATILLLVAALGFSLGRMSLWGSQENSLEAISEEEFQIALHYNKTFGEAPSPSTDYAWSTLFPIGRGFVQHPQMSPDISGLAVFHQLHCLNSLRVAIYTPVVELSVKQNHSMHHVRHCIDYLRQSLICHSDVSLEPVNWKLGGVTGWNSQRTCANYTKVVQWAETFRTHNQTGNE